MLNQFFPREESLSHFKDQPGKFPGRTVEKSLTRIGQQTREVTWAGGPLGLRWGWRGLSFCCDPRNSQPEPLNTVHDGPGTPVATLPSIPSSSPREQNQASPHHLLNAPDGIRVGEARYLISFLASTIKPDHLGNDYRKLAIAWGAPPMKAFEGKQGWRGWRVAVDILMMHQSRARRALDPLSITTDGIF
jgi:hypothetical protein